MQTTRSTGAAIVFCSRFLDKFDFLTIFIKWYTLYKTYLATKVSYIFLLHFSSYMPNT